MGIYGRSRKAAMKQVPMVTLWNSKEKSPYNFFSPIDRWGDINEFVCDQSGAALNESRRGEPSAGDWLSRNNRCISWTVHRRKNCKRTFLFSFSWPFQWVGFGSDIPGHPVDKSSFSSSLKLVVYSNERGKSVSRITRSERASRVDFQ